MGLGESKPKESNVMDASRSRGIVLIGDSTIDNVVWVHGY